MALDNYYRNKIEGMKLEIIQGQAVLRRLEAQRNDYNSRVRLLREELGLLQQPGSYVGEVVKVMSTKKVLVKVHPEGKYGGFPCIVIEHSPYANVTVYCSGGYLRRCGY
jgi:26S proteasome regulatory subunit T6